VRKNFQFLAFVPVSDFLECFKKANESTNRF